MRDCMGAGRMFAGVLHSVPARPWPVAEPFRHSRLSLTMQKKSSDSKEPEKSAEYGPSEKTQCPPEPKRDAY